MEKLADAQRMESLGLMASSVAHDLNNIMAGIITYPELLLMDLGEDFKYREELMMVREAGKRAAAVVNDLLTVARGATCKRGAGRQRPDQRLPQLGGVQGNLPALPGGQGRLLPGGQTAEHQLLSDAPQQINHEPGQQRGGSHPDQRPDHPVHQERSPYRASPGVRNH